MKKTIICAVMTAILFPLWAARPSLQWSTLGNSVDPATGRDIHTERLVVAGHRGIRHLCFNRLARKMKPVNPRDTIVEIIPGYYYIASPRFGSTYAPLTIDITVDAPLTDINYRPDGFHAVMTDGSVSPVSFTRAPISLDPAHYTSSKTNPMPAAADIYHINESLACDFEPGPYDFIPTFKSVELDAATGLCPVDAPVGEAPSADPRDDYYRIIIGPDSITLRYTSPRSLIMARRVLTGRIIPANPGGLPQAVIEDYPSLPYRAMMMDIARNYFNASQVQSIINLLAAYRMNTLHFHLTDDEAWRLEIPGLPELTDVGARRGHTTGEETFLAQLFAGDGNPDSDNGTANGYITRDEFIDLLRYAASLGITVIPEIESPGHARAAIKAMMARERATADSTYRLHDVADTSAYTSAQSFHDNVMNPALPGTYRFMAHVIDGIAAMYSEAGVPLEGIHIGGDEVPAKAWHGSPAVAALIRRLGTDDPRRAHAFFVDSVASILHSRGIPMLGWQDIALNRSPEFNARIAPLTAGINCWTLASSGIAGRAIADGYNVILSNVDHFYLDQCYNSHPDEQGLRWGGTVDELTAFSGYADSLCPAPAGPGKVIGISCHLFGETLRNIDQVRYFMLPKMLGAAERAWNPGRSVTPAQFNAIVGARELPAFALRGYNFHLRQPGIIVDNGVVKMNSPYGPSRGVIRYTLDGTEPTEASTLYEGPFAMPDGATAIRARYFYLGRNSLSTVL